MRPDALVYRVVATGQVLDTITLAGGQLRFDTGAARQVLAAQQERFGWTDEQTYDFFVGWSNGYVAISPAGQGE